MDNDSYFKNYRRGLRREAQLLASAASILRRLDECRNDQRRHALNVAPEFFHLTRKAYFALVIVTCYKLFDKGSDRSIPKFLNWAEQNLDIFSADRHRDRHGPKDGDGQNAPCRELFIDWTTIEDHRRRIRELSILDPVRTWRDKLLAHSDKKYFDDPRQLDDDMPLMWPEFDQAIKLSEEILDTYSGANDGLFHPLEHDSAESFEQVLDLLLKSLTGTS